MTDAIRDVPEDKARIRSEIVRTREGMSETIDAIQDRLSPRNLASQAKETVKEATVGRVKQAARSVSDSASNLAESTRGAAAHVTDSVRQNPWPALLIGAGTAWLLIDGAKQSRRDRASGVVDYEHDDGTTGYYEDNGTTGYYEKVRSSAAAYGYEEFEGAARRSLRTGRRMASELQGLLRRNPLAVGAVAAAVGVAVGLAIPETERENRLMGETRDNLVERAQGVAQDAVQKAKQVAGDAALQVTGESTTPAPRA